MQEISIEVSSLPKGQNFDKRGLKFRCVATCGELRSELISHQPERDGLRAILDQMPRDWDTPWHSSTNGTPSLSGRSARRSACLTVEEGPHGTVQRKDKAEVVARYKPLEKTEE